MGAFDVVPNVVIPNPDDPEASAAFRKKWGWEPHEQVIIRGTFTAVEQEAVENAASGFVGKGRKKDVELRQGTARQTMLTRMIVDWTLAVNGKKVDVSPAMIRRLPANYRTPILEACDEIAAGMTEEEQEDFLPDANEPIAENSMETS